MQDLGRAARHFADTYGAGPFLSVEHLEFDDVTFAGESCVWDHSLAFGAWGSIQIELQRPHTIEPPALAELIGRDQSMHLSYRVEDLASERARLQENGLRWFFEARVGPVHFNFFRDPHAPSYIEVHQANSYLEDFDGRIVAAAANWDGDQALIALETPPSQ